MGVSLLALTATACALLPTPTRTPQVEECPAALLSGVLRRNGETLVVATDSGSHRVVWPTGYAVLQGAPLQLRDDAAQIVAAEGDPIFIGGGFSDGDEWFIACGYLSTDPP